MQLPLIIDTKTQNLIHLEVTVSCSRLATVIITCMYVQFCRKITVQYEIDRIFPLNTSPLVASQIIQTGIQYDGRNNSPIQCRLYLSNKVRSNALAFLQTKIHFIYIFITYIPHRPSQRSYKDRQIKLFLIQFVVHTDTGG